MNAKISLFQMVVDLWTSVDNVSESKRMTIFFFFKISLVRKLSKNVVLTTLIASDKIVWIQYVTQHKSMEGYKQLSSVTHTLLVYIKQTM